MQIFKFMTIEMAKFLDIFGLKALGIWADRAKKS